MERLFGTTVLVSLLLTAEVLSQQCYNQPNCAGGSVAVSTARECCVGTDDGMSFADGSGTCVVSQCVVHGFASALYDVEEGERLDTVFQLNVKGMTSFPNLMLGGSITSAAGPNTRTTDFENLPATSLTGNRADIYLFTTNDEITLEYDDSVLLTFTSSLPGIIQSFEDAGEFVRNTTTVNIIDNDRLEINFEESDYSITEGDPQRPNIRLLFRRTQNPFTMTLYPVTITEAIDPAGYNTSAFIASKDIDEATPGADFTIAPFIITIPATEDESIGRFVVPYMFNVADDDINEAEQSFALVGQLGSDVPDNFTCLQRVVGDPQCFGRTGVTEIIIVDDDAMVIGFRQRRQSVVESDIVLILNVSSLRFSELDYEVHLRHLLSSSTATVESSTFPVHSQFDAQFGSREDFTDVNDPLEAIEIVLSGTLTLRYPQTTIIFNDFLVEEAECYTIRILSPDSAPHDYFDCNEDASNPTDYFCLHTVCILNDDGPFEVGYVQTTYTVIEGEGPVRVCVNLTKPEEDIGDEVVFVEAFDFINSTHIPAGATLATPDRLNSLTGMYDMRPFSDYQQQILGVNHIRNSVINATRLIICYDQPIYNDMRLEESEYFGLTLSVRTLPTTVLTEVRPMYDQVAIQIMDDDDLAVVGIERTIYTVMSVYQLVIIQQRNP